MSIIRILTLECATLTCKAASGSSQQQPSNECAEEDDSEDELGYSREPIRGQSAFQTQELRRHDDAHDAMRLYHQAKASQDSGYVRVQPLP